MGTKHSAHRLHSHGHKHSSTSRADSSHQSTGESCASPRDEKVSTHASCGPTESSIETTKEQLHRHPTHTHKDSPLDRNPFTRILLKFPQAAKAFNGVRSTFKTFDKEGHGYIVSDDLPAIYKELGVSFSEDEINQVFEESDMKENGKLTFKELLVSLAIGFLLHRIPSLEKNRLSVFYTSRSGSINGSISGSVGRNNNIGGNSVGGSSTSSTAMAMNGDDVELRSAYQLAIDAFLWFDTEGSGYINRNDMSVQLEASMARHSPTKKLKRRSGGYKDSGEDSKNWSIWERRFAEMDWNHNGMIHFNEFLMAFESWVGVDDDEDEEDEEETRHETEKETSTAVDSSAQ
ncbi:hypothetical protein PHYSODRAFT_264348 [Phytophthora sojae]|uniref:EF-hand domain-containing protein n=1 Tax=Phytophthora sojae (strain P6497) TaxID=1094619 RepID=G4ZE60_PHYSP|nr:hypothetical protein PHYSODRAFT_264348 [Phytophthora sojae]EGZ17411.1 hypothetical protein PHYSODRAFT_264348 [Phytophthora sojae]|eukprot:XP_009526469.1 hypothetical protein PHYSODRAFT_264348 [Phytophthora sojae]